MNITDFKVDGWASIDANDIPIDTVFSGRMGLCWAISSVFLKGYDVIVDLNSPRNTWVAFSALISLKITDHWIRSSLLMDRVVL